MYCSCMFFCCTFITNEVFSLIKEENNQYNTLTSWHFCSNWTLTNSTSLVFLSSCIWTACTWVSHSAFLADTIRSICRINWKQSKVYDGIIIIVNGEKMACVDHLSGYISCLISKDIHVAVQIFSKFKLLKSFWLLVSFVLQNNMIKRKWNLSS